MIEMGFLGITSGKTNKQTNKKKKGEKNELFRRERTSFIP